MNRSRPTLLGANRESAPSSLALTRRTLMWRTLFGAGAVGLRALATGLPAAFVARPLTARADALVDPQRAQFLILSTSSAGDPLNANVPGTYDAADIVHAADPRVAKTAFSLGGVGVTGAYVWSTLPAAALARTVFFHHATLTNNHPNLPKVMQLMGDTAKQEMLPSLAAKVLAPVLGTVQREPVSAGAGDLLTFDGRSLPNLPPTGLRDLLAKPDSPLNRLETLRDQSLDELHALLKQDGTEAQRQYLDRLALSRQQARSLSGDLLDMLATIKSDGTDGQITAAVALVKLKVSPVVAIRINFGGDNHQDPDLLKSEVPQTETGVQQIGALWTALAAAGLSDQVTFAAYNVFGRTLKKKGTTGRDHWGSHHTTVIIGKNVKPGVVGGLEAKAGDYAATAIDSATGRAVPGGAGADIPFSETLAAMGKTLGAALGVDEQTLSTQILHGKAVRAVLS